MAMGTERSKPLHNFTLPCDLRWGNQRFLRCMKVNSGGQISNSSDSSDQHHQIQQRRSTRDRQRDKDFPNGSGPAPWVDGRRFVDGDDDDGIAATREKVMLDLQTAADKMKSAFFKDGGLEEGEVSVSRPLPLPPPPPPPPSAEGEAQRPWNLRTRRAACRTQPIGFVAPGAGSNGGGAKGPRVDAPRPIPGSFQMRAPAVAATAQNSPTHPSASGDKIERAKFSVSLPKRDIEEDFFAIAGHRPPRRPKKRARIVQKQLDTLFPGLWLTEVTPDMYKVPDAAP